MKKTFIAPVAQVQAMGTESLLQSSNVAIKNTPITNSNSGSFTPAAKTAATYSFDL